MKRFSTRSVHASVALVSHGVTWVPGQRTLHVGIAAEFAKTSGQVGRVLVLVFPEEIGVTVELQHSSALVVWVFPSHLTGCRVSLEAVFHLKVVASTQVMFVIALIAISVNDGVVAPWVPVVLVVFTVRHVALSAALLSAVREEVRRNVCDDPLPWLWLRLWLGLRFWLGRSDFTRASLPVDVLDPSLRRLAFVVSGDALGGDVTVRADIVRGDSH